MLLGVCTVTCSYLCGGDGGGGGGGGGVCVRVCVCVCVRQFLLCSTAAYTHDVHKRALNTLVAPSDGRSSILLALNRRKFVCEMHRANCHLRTHVRQLACAKKKYCHNWTTGTFDWHKHQASGTPNCHKHLEHCNWHKR